MGGAIDGNCDVGSVTIDKTPMKIITSETPMARTGLFKNLLNIYFNYF